MDVLFDNESINRKFNIYLAERPVVSIAELDYEEIAVPGRDGSLTRELGYSNKPIPLRFNFIHKTNVKQTIREIASWLTGKKIVAFSDDLSVYRIISQIKISDATNDIKEYADFTVTLETEPFWYEDVGTQTLLNGTTTTVNNPSSVEVGVVMKVSGTGKCNVRINGKLMILTDVQDFVIVDGIRGVAHRYNISQDNKMQGEYPKLEAGNNTIVVSGGATKVELEKRWSWR